VFLVPDENCTEAASTAPAGLQLIRVTGLGDAVTQLEALDGGAPPRSC
jgi:Lon-like protease